jgi:hypothetical protein
MAGIKEKAKADYLEDSELQEKIQEILHPDLVHKEPVIAIQFGVPRDKQDEWRQVIGMASAYNTYSSRRVGKLIKHRVEFKRDQAWEIHQLYQMLEKSPHLEIFINDIRLPYAATLWIPLLWFYLPD